MTTNNNLLFACGHRKSGTSLFLNLLDSHPEIDAIPCDIALLYAYFPHWTDSDYLAAERRRRIDAVLFDDYQSNFGDKFAASGIDLAAWKAAAQASLSDDDLQDIFAVLRAVIAGWQGCTSRSANKKWVAVKETGIELFADNLSKEFKTAHFIQIVRDPRDNFAALKSGVSKKYRKLGQDEGDTLLSLLIRVQASLRFAQLNEHSIGTDRYRVVRFEDIVSAPDENMASIAHWLEIGVCAELTRPTFLGTPTRGNSHDDVAFDGISTAHLGAWRERISENEAKVIEFHLGREMETFGYHRRFAERDAANAWSDFYKHFNHKYFFADRFTGTSGASSQ